MPSNWKKKPSVVRVEEEDRSVKHVSPKFDEPLKRGDSEQVTTGEVSSETLLVRAVSFVMWEYLKDVHLLTQLATLDTPR